MLVLRQLICVVGSRHLHSSCTGSRRCKLSCEDWRKCVGIGTASRSSHRDERVIESIPGKISNKGFRLKVGVDEVIGVRGENYVAQ